MKNYRLIINKENAKYLIKINEVFFIIDADMKTTDQILLNIHSFKKCNDVYPWFRFCSFGNFLYEDAPFNAAIPPGRSFL